MKKAFLLYSKYMSKDGSYLTIGGIQTYITQLSYILKKQGFSVVIYQFADIHFEKYVNNVLVKGIDMSSTDNKKIMKKKLYKKARNEFNSKSDILIFACESMVVKNNLKNSIAIQHGVNWDVKSHENFNSFFNRIFLFRKAITANKLIKRIHQVQKLVCVDYNFVNWYRSQVAYEDVKLEVVPNSTYIPEPIEKSYENIKIIFARRLVERRGTKIFANAILSILRDYKNISITFAGEGQDEEKLKNIFKNESRVDFIKYEAKESISIHSKYDIAVVPTIGSEGTSLSLLEAMASSCAVVATNVGGMTNIIINDYNGLLINPNEQELTHALEKLITDSKLRKRLSNSGYETVSKGFNQSLWNQRWSNIVKSVESSK